VAETLSARLRRLKAAAGARDIRMKEVTLVRAGEVHLMTPGLFSEDWPKPIIANQIDTIARDFAGSLAPLPTLRCSSRSMRTDADKRRAEKKNKIGSYYWHCSNLATSMYQGADWYATYGFLPMYVEPDYTRDLPMIRLENPIGCYYEKDRFGCTLFFSKCWREPVWKLAEQFPDAAGRLIERDGAGRPQMGQELEVVRVADKTHWTLVVPERNDLVLLQYPHKLGRCPVEVAERPGLTDEPRGQFDQVLWVWLAKARLALMQLDAASKAVNAPIVIPRDAIEFSIGPDAVIQTDNRQGVGRVPLDLPGGAFAVSEKLDDEVKEGARFPEGRNGGIDASVITGRGVQALMGGYSSLIAEGQIILGEALAAITEVCFEMDRTLWPDMRRTIRGTAAGEPYEISYTPVTDIGDNFSCDVTYGYAAGLSPSQAVVMLLQLRGDDLISRDTFRRQLPIDIDVDDEQRRIDVDKTEDALQQGLFALLQSLGPIATQGLDPLPIIKSGTVFVKERRNGTPVAEAMEKAFAPPPEAAQEAGGASPGQPADPLAAVGQGAATPFLEERMSPGSTPTVCRPAWPRARLGLPPGGMPDIKTLVAGLRAGRPVLDATITRRIPTG
jgi:hypothetical protein